MEARDSHKKAVDALAALETPAPQAPEEKVVTLAHVGNMITLFSPMGAAQQGADILRRIEPDWNGSVQAAAGAAHAPPLLPPAVGVATGDSGKKRSPKLAQSTATVQPAKQRVLETQPTVIQSQDTQATQSTQPAQRSQVAEALAATEASPAGKAAAEALPRGRVPTASAAAPEDREFPPTVAMSDGEKSKRRGKRKVARRVARTRPPAGDCLGPPRGTARRRKGEVSRP